MNTVRRVFLIGAALLIFVPSLTADRRDPPGEGSASEIANVLARTDYVGVFCGGDVDFHACAFFQHALASALSAKYIMVALFHYPEPRPSIQSFYIPPMPFPLPSQVTLRMIEDDTQPDHIRRLWLGGFCFNQNGAQWQLPRWFQKEGQAKETEPLESDKIAAAAKLAHEFADYWINAVKSESDED